MINGAAYVANVWQVAMGHIKDVQCGPQLIDTTFIKNA